MSPATPTIREALLAMGYTEVRDRQWAKPIGFQVFAFTEKPYNVWANWFRDAQGNVSLWEKHTFQIEETHGSFLKQLKSWECYTRTDIGVGMKNPDSDFHLRALDLDAKDLSKELSEYRRLIEDGAGDTAEALKLRAELIEYFGQSHPLILDCDKLRRFQSFKQARK